MRRTRLQRGSTMMDVMMTLFLLGIAGAIFTATFPSAITASRQAQEYKVATTIAVRKMEQLRALNYESLTYGILYQTALIDGSPAEPLYSFTGVDSVATRLPAGTGQVSVVDVDAARGVKRVQVIVKWRKGKTSTRDVVITSLFSDKRTRTGS